MKRSVIALAAVLIPIAGVFQVFDGGQAVGAGVLRGAGDTTPPLLVMLASYWLVGVPVSAYLGFATDLRARYAARFPSRRFLRDPESHGRAPRRHPSH